MEDNELIYPLASFLKILEPLYQYSSSNMGI
jgi:hypothetical protein